VTKQPERDPDAPHGQAVGDHVRDLADRQDEDEVEVELDP
jgi:hypothetical protein